MLIKYTETCYVTDDNKFAIVKPKTISEQTNNDVWILIDKNGKSLFNGSFDDCTEYLNMVL